MKLRSMRRKTRVTDALKVCEAAVEKGILPGYFPSSFLVLYGNIEINCKYSSAGGGVALLYASKELDKLQPANVDQKTGVQIIQNALKVCPSSCVCEVGWLGAAYLNNLTFKLESGCKHACRFLQFLILRGQA